MDKLKQWVALTVVGCLAVAAAGWFLLVSPKRSEAADLRLQADQKTQANTQLQSQITMLKAQAKQLPQQQARLAAVAAKIPDNPALPALIRSLTKAADETGVELVRLAPLQPEAVAAAGAAPAAPVTAAPAGASTAAAPTASAGTLQSIGLNLDVVGGYFQIEQFFDRVENLTRAMKVKGFTLAPGANPVQKNAPAGANPGKVLQASITGAVYMATGRTSTAALTGK